MRGICFSRPSLRTSEPCRSCTCSESNNLFSGKEMASLYIRAALTASEPPKARPEATASASERTQPLQELHLGFYDLQSNCLAPAVALFVSVMHTAAAATGLGLSNMLCRSIENITFIYLCSASETHKKTFQ